MLAAMAVCIVAMIATLRGVKAILSGYWRPSAATWWTWFFNDAVILFFSYKTGSRAELSLLGVFTVGALVIAIMAISRGSKEGNLLFDRLCVVVAILSLVLGQIIGSDWGLILSIAANAIGALPTYIKVISSPESEDATTWGIFCLSSFISLLTVSQWSWQVALFPIYSVTGTTALTLLSMRKVGVSNAEEAASS